MFFGWLADKIPVAKVLIAGAVALIIQALLFYIHLPYHSTFAVVVVCALFGFISGIRALCPIIFLQLFPTQNRLTSVSVIFNCVAAVVGALLPMSLFYFTSLIGATSGLYLTFMVGLTLIC